MIGLIRGVVKELSKEDISALRASASGADRVKGGAMQDFAVVRLIGPRGTADVQLLRDERGDFYARPAGGDKPIAFKLNRKRMQSLCASWPRYRGSFVADETIRPTRDVVLSQPYAAGWEFIDKAMLSARLLRGRPTEIENPARHLEDEQFIVRLPNGFDAQRSYGLLVWVNAGTSTDLPDAFSEWLDKKGFVCIGAFNIGNSRPAADRYQLAHDMVQTAKTRFLIDDERVYVTGISGGGRVSSHLWMGWPETFTGAAPIVGLGFFERVPAANGKYFPPDFDKPEEPQFSICLKRPLAVMSGPKDFNYDFIKPCVEIIRIHGFEARLFESPEMGHELPTAEMFTGAMNWVDGPGLGASQERVKRARDVLQTLPSDLAARRSGLIEVTRIAPWSGEAWEAFRLLTETTPTPEGEVPQKTEAPSR
jgi:hypothetical protein